MSPRSLLLALAAGAALAGCGGEEAVLDPLCTADVETYLEALRTAPGAVRLESGTSLSDCVSAARNDGDLQTAGLLMVRAADRLARRAEDRADTAAALQLGYLTGAAQRGAARTQGVQAELARRIGRAAAVLGDPPPDVEQALLRGLRAGERTG